MCDVCGEKVAILKKYVHEASCRLNELKIAERKAAAKARFRQDQMDLVDAEIERQDELRAHELVK